MTLSSNLAYETWHSSQIWTPILVFSDVDNNSGYFRPLIPLLRIGLDDAEISDVLFMTSSSLWTNMTGEHRVVLWFVIRSFWDSQFNSNSAWVVFGSFVQMASSRLVWYEWLTDWLVWVVRTLVFCSIVTWQLHRPLMGQKWAGQSIYPC